MVSTPRDSLGRPLRDLRISVTDRCNFRCPYCMPKAVFGPGFRFLQRRELLTYEEIARAARVFASLGVRKLRITGGEPLLRRDLPELIQQLTAIPGIDDLALTTNGTLLAGMATALRSAGLARVSVSLDSLDGEIFRRMNDVGTSVDAVLAGIDAAEAAGFASIKINAVVVRGLNDHTLVDLARHFRGTPHIVRFIEYMDVGNSNGWRLDQVVTAKEIVQRIDAELPIEPIAPNYRGEVAKRWRYRDGSGEVGIIASVSQPFCGDCSRARLSSEGRLFTCLFGTDGFDVRALLRSPVSDDEVRERLSVAWQRRDDRYSELRSIATLGLPKVEMSHIGG